MQRHDRPPGPINPGVRIGHVHLKVADLERAIAFYSGVLGFDSGLATAVIDLNLDTVSLPAGDARGTS